MNANVLDTTDFEVTQTALGKDKALIIGEEEFIKINVSNKLSSEHSKFDYNVTTKDSLTEGIQEITEHSFSLIVLDIDNLEGLHLNRFYKIIMSLQIPTMLIGSDPTILNKLRSEFDNKLLTFLPKSILNSMFGESLNLLLNKTNKAERFNNRVKNIGAQKKPFTFYLLATLLFCEPLIKLCYLKLNTGFAWETVLRTAFSIEGIFHNFEFWGIFPLAGLALVTIRPWSLFVFTATQIYALFTVITYEKFTWPYIAETPHISTSLLIGLNAAILMYLLIPENRKPYWFKTSSLWRNTARFAINLKTNFRYNDIVQETTITNISESGAYFTCKEKKSNV